MTEAPGGLSGLRGSMAAMSGTSGGGGPDGGQPRPEGSAAPTSRKAARTKNVRPRRLDESMTLLREVMERPLDPGYAAAAERRAAGEPPRGRAVSLVVAVVIGFVVTVAVLVLRAPAPATVQAREQLAQQVEARAKQNDETQARVERFRDQVRAAQEKALAASGDTTATATASALGIAAGEVAVVGPGLVVTMDDAPGSRDDGGSNADPRGDSTAEDGRVFDRDLQTVVNGLWQAGAEAVSINDRRLTALSAIRSAGEAILVDYRPLSPPYVIKAIGDPQSMQTRFAAASAGAYLQSLQDNFGVKAGIEVDQDLRIEGSRSLSLDRADPRPSTSSTALSTAGTGTGSATPAASGSGAALPSASSRRPSPSEASP